MMHACFALQERSRAEMNNAGNPCDPGKRSCRVSFVCRAKDGYYCYWMHVRTFMLLCSSAREIEREREREKKTEMEVEMKWDAK